MNVDRRCFLLAGSGLLLGACTGVATRSNRLESEEAKIWQEAARIRAVILRPTIPKWDFSILDFGALTSVDESTDSRPAILQAIAACSAAGGGRVVIPAGRWFCKGPIHLKSRIDLHLAEGAEVVFSGDADHYLPVVATRWEGVECFSYSPMVYAADCEDIAITGRGKLNGQGEKNFLPWRPLQKSDQDRLRQMGKEGVPVEARVFGAGSRLRPHFVQFYRCQRILIEEITLQDSPFWVLHPVYCDHVTVRGINIVSKHINSDGVDPDSSQYVLVEKCRFEVGDDGVAIKAGRDQDGWRVGRKSQYIVISDNQYIGDTGGGVAIGSEMSGGVSDIYIERYQLPKANHALYFKSNLDRGGQIERVFIRDIDVGSADSVLIFTNSYHSYRGGNAPTRFENVDVRRVRCQSARVGISLEGHPTAPVRAIHLSEIDIAHAETAVAAIHTEAISFDRVRINQKLVKNLSNALAPVKSKRM